MTEDFLRKMSGDAMTQPIAYDGEMFKHFDRLISTDAIDPKMKKDFWGFSDKEAVISNMNPTTIIQVLRDWEINELWWMMSHPEKDFDFEQMARMGQARAHLRQRLHRSLNGFERKLQATEIKEVNLNKGQEGKTAGLLNFFGLFKKKADGQ